MAAKLDANGGSEPLRATRRQKSNDKRPSPGGGYSARLRPIARIDDVARTDGTGNRQMPAKVTAKTGNTHAAEPQCAPEAIAAFDAHLDGHAQARAAFRRIVNQGWTDAIRVTDPHATRGPFTFWDYQGSAWERDNGIRIDHLLLSPQAADLMRGAGIDRDQRAGVKPSDHVPVFASFDLAV